jgi:hypothetical protein
MMDKLSDRQIKKLVEEVSNTVTLSMRTFQEELKYPKEEVTHSVMFFEKDQKIAVYLRERIFRKILKSYEALQCDSGLLFDKSSHCIFISLQREDEGSRALEFVLRRILAFLLKRKDELVIKNKLELKKNISTFLSIREDRFKIVHSKKEGYGFVLKSRKCDIMIKRKNPENLEEAVKKFADVIKKVC